MGKGGGGREPDSSSASKAGLTRGNRGVVESTRERGVKKSRVFLAGDLQRNRFKKQKVRKNGKGRGTHTLTRMARQSSLAELPFTPTWRPG